MTPEERIKRLEEQVEKQERTILKMQKAIEILRDEVFPDMPVALPRPEPLKQPTPVGHPVNAQAQPTPRAAVEPLPPPEPVDWENLIGRVWLPRIFILVLLIGVLWGFKAAVSAGYLTEPVRCILGVVASGVLIYLGERQIRDKRDALGQVLLGGAVSLLVLTTFAAHMLYGLIGTAPAFAFNVLTVAGGVYLAYRHRSEALGILATLGGFLVPFLVESSDPSTVFFISYEVLMSIAFLLFASRQGYKILYYVAIGLFHLTALVFLIAVNGGNEADKYALAYGLLAHHLILLTMALLRRAVTGEGKSQFTIFSSAGLTVFWWFSLISNQDLEFYKGFLLAMTIVYAGLALWRRADRLQLSVFSSTAFFTLMLYLFNLLEGDYENMALLVEGTITLWLAYHLSIRHQMLIGWLIWGIGAFKIITDPIEVIASLDTLAWILLLGSILALYDRLKRPSADATDPDEVLARSAFVRLFGVGFAVLFLAFLTMITDVLAKPLPLEGEYMAVSGIWALYAIVVIIFGTIKKSQFIRLSGVLLLFITLLKLIFVDLPSLSIVVRAILFITLGAIGVGISRLFYQKGR